MPIKKLPKNVTFKHGRYYYIARIDGKRKWLALSRSYTVAMRQYRTMGSNMRMSETDPIHGYFREMLANAKSNAKRRGLEFHLSEIHVSEMANRSGMACELTGIEFSLGKIGNSYRRPFAPSIDRIDSSKGYTPKNCRLICCSANYALNQWGESTFRKLAEGLLAKKCTHRQKM